MKVLHVLSSNIFSGAEIVACQIISMMKDVSDIEMAYCSPDGEIRKALLDRGVTFMPIQTMNTVELKKAIQEYQPDLIHAHDMRASFLSARACGNISLISHIHNNAFDSRRFSLKSIAYLYAALKAKHIFWVSESSKEGYLFKDLIRNKSEVLTNIIDIKELYFKANADHTIYEYDVVFLGRLTYQKNPERLLRLMRMVVDKNNSIKMAIIGTGDLENLAKDICKELNLENNIHFLGFQRNPYKILQSAKAMVMTSRWEGLPMCALEALALGTPVICTPADGLVNIIQNDITGYISDDDEILAEKILLISRSTDIQKVLSCKSKDLSKEINDMDKYKNILLKVYRQCDM